MTCCDDHTHGPDHYVAWHQWAEMKTRTHEQRPCDECGLWMIWVPRIDLKAWGAATVEDAAPV